MEIFIPQTTLPITLAIDYQGDHKINFWYVRRQHIVIEVFVYFDCSIWIEYYTTRY